LATEIKTLCLPQETDTRRTSSSGEARGTAVKQRDDEMNAEPSELFKCVVVVAH